MSQKEFDLIILDEGKIKFYLIPISKMNQGIQNKFEFACRAGNSYGDLLIYKDRIIFPEDSKDEVNRKERTHKHTTKCKDKNAQSRYAQTAQEARGNGVLFEDAIHILKCFKENRVQLVELSNVHVRKIYSWAGYIKDYE